MKMEFNDLMDKITCMDCIDGLKLIPDNSIDLVVTSPPYNLGKNYGIYRDNLTHQDYLIWTKSYLKEIFRVLKSDGRLCLNIAMDSSVNGRIPLYSDILQGALLIGFNYNQTIIWAEESLTSKTAWGSWMSASAPQVLNPTETIILLYKNVWKKRSNGETTILKKEFIKWTTGIWRFNGDRHNIHPASFPIELPDRCIKLFSYKGDIVLDPFIGSGTTAVACRMLDRHFIGFEISPEYVKTANKRLDSWMKQTKLEMLG